MNPPFVPIDPAQASFREQRRRLLTATSGQIGLDSVVSEHTPGTLTWSLTLHFVPASAKVMLRVSNIRLLAPWGATTQDPRVVRVETSSGSAPDNLVVVVEASNPARAAALEDDPGVYVLQLVDVPHLDRFFTRAPFSFSAEVVGHEPKAPLPDEEMRATPEINYLARDFAAVRQVMLDRMALLVPAWSERSPADLGVAVVEVLAYAADHLAYTQDAVATEAYLPTAHHRISVRRHARLLGYTLGEGSSARTWVHFQVAGRSRFFLERGTQVLSGAGDLPTRLDYDDSAYQKAIASGVQVFETALPAWLDPRQNRMPIYTWGARDFTLPQGVIQAALCGHRRHLRAGDVVVFEQTRSLRNGQASDADPSFRHAVRLSEDPVLETDPANLNARGQPWPFTLIRWFPDDALPFSLPVSGHAGGRWRRYLAMARGNLVLADDGQTVVEALPPVPASEPHDGKPGTPYRPTLQRYDLAWRVVPDPESLRGSPAADALSPKAAKALPAITLIELDDPCTPIAEAEAETARQGKVWSPRHDLLSSSRFARHFVAEIDNRRLTTLRFGDNHYGRRPARGTRFVAWYRVGGGPQGNLGADAIAHVVSDDQRLLKVCNPLPAAGGVAPESLAHARRHAPTSYQVQRRCVIPKDFITTAKSVPEVRGAAVDSRRTGSWLTNFLYLQRHGSRLFDAAFAEKVWRQVEPRLLIGQKLALRPPRWVALALVVEIIPTPGRPWELVRRLLEDTFSDRRLPDGTLGYFYPDNFTFGQPVYPSDVIAQACQVAGVEQARALTFRRYDGLDPDSLERGSITIGALEIAQVCNQLEAPQLGTIRFVRPEKR